MEWTIDDPCDVEASDQSEVTVIEPEPTPTPAPEPPPTPAPAPPVDPELPKTGAADVLPWLVLLGLVLLVAGLVTKGYVEHARRRDLKEH